MSPSPEGLDHERYGTTPEEVEKLQKKVLERNAGGASDITARVHKLIRLLNVELDDTVTKFAIQQMRGDDPPSGEELAIASTSALNHVLQQFLRVTLAEALMSYIVSPKSGDGEEKTKTDDRASRGYL